MFSLKTKSLKYKELANQRREWQVRRRQDLDNISESGDVIENKNN